MILDVLPLGFQLIAPAIDRNCSDTDQPDLSKRSSIPQEHHIRISQQHTQLSEEQAILPFVPRSVPMLRAQQDLVLLPTNLAEHEDDVAPLAGIIEVSFAPFPIDWLTQFATSGSNFFETCILIASKDQGLCSVRTYSL